MTPDEGARSTSIPTPCPWTGSAAVYLLGSLRGDELRAFLQHLDARCPRCEHELARDRETLAWMDATELWNELGLRAPSPEGIEQILARARAERQEDPASAPPIPSDGSAAPAPQRVASDDANGTARSSPTDADAIQTWKRWSQGTPAHAVAGLATTRASESDWQATAIDGIRVRRLAVDAERRLVTMLVRMERGTSYPAHRHAAAEECYVVDGSLHVEQGVAGPEVVLTTGDFQRAERGSIHGRQWTDTGCTLLIVSSQDDELVA